MRGLTVCHKHGGKGAPRPHKRALDRAAQEEVRKHERAEKTRQAPILRTLRLGAIEAEPEQAPRVLPRITKRQPD